MGKSKRRNDLTTSTVSGCATCGAPRPRDQTGRLNWSATGPFLHCEGSRVAWHGLSEPKPIPHHGHVLYPPCWRCKQPMGCDECAGIPQEVLCTRCAVWLLPIGLAHHGPMLNTKIMVERRKGLVAPGVDEYPLPHQRLYRSTA